MQFINPLEAIKRLAAAQGIDVLNLVKTPEQLQGEKEENEQKMHCLLYTSDAADDTPCVDLGGRRIIKK